MNDKPLVFFDQWSVTPTRFELTGNTVRALSFISIGRQQLGQMKAQSGVYDLMDDGGLVATGGTGFVHMNQTQAPGVTIHTIHNDGLDIVRIHCAQERVKSGKHQPQAETNSGEILGACGDMSGSGDPTYLPWVWKDGPGYTYPSGAGSGSAVGISWLADEACGFFLNDETTDEDYNFFWSRSADTIDIGLCKDNGYATCISGDATTVGTGKGWYWTADNGWIQVALREIAAGPDEFGQAAILCLGADATVAGGWLGVDNDFGGQFRRPCLWTRDDAGEFSAEVLDDGDATWESTDAVGLVQTVARTVIASGDTETATFTPAHYEGHTFVPGRFVTDRGDEGDYLGYTDPTEPFERTNYRDTGVVPEDGGIATTDSVLYDVVITHQNGGAVTGVRYDGSAACGYIAIQDEISNTQAAIWGSDRALRALGLPGGYVSAQATGINQGGDIVISGLGTLETGEQGWWIWSEATGFVDVSVGRSAGYCISQDGSRSGGMSSGDESINAGTSDMVDVDTDERKHTPFEVPRLGECYGVTSFSVYQDEMGNLIFTPPMPGLRMDMTLALTAPLVGDDFTKPAVDDEPS